MWKLLQLIFIGHSHKWKIIKQTDVTFDNGCKGTRYYLQCEHCGTIKCKDPAN